MTPNEGPNSDDWNFTEIELHDSTRAARLIAAGSAKDLIQTLGATLRSAVDQDQLRFGVDFHGDNSRAIIQFPVTQDVYDWFFNARTGYRAQFWARPEQGHEYNKQLVAALSKQLSEAIPEAITARKIAVHTVADASRNETDEGPTVVPRDEFLRSLDLEFAKIWPCERLIQIDGTNPRSTFAMENAERYPPKLNVRRWAVAVHPKTGLIGEGLRAPYPDLSECWLDLKGGYVAPGNIYQPKSPRERANSLYERGWT